MHAQLTEVDLPLRLGLGGPTVYMVHSTPPMRRALACYMAPMVSVTCCSSLERMLFGMIMHSAVRWWYGVRLVGSVWYALLHATFFLSINFVRKSAGFAGSGT